MKKLLLSLVLSVAAVFGGCAQLPGGNMPSTASLTSTATADLDQGIAIFQQRGDLDGVKCYTAIKAHVPALAAPVVPVGAFSAYAVARTDIEGVLAGEPADVQSACAKLKLDAMAVPFKVRSLLHP